MPFSLARISFSTNMSAVSALGVQLLSGFAAMKSSYLALASAYLPCWVSVRARPSVASGAMKLAGSAARNAA